MSQRPIPDPKPLPPLPVIATTPLMSIPSAKGASTLRQWRPITLRRALLSALIFITAALAIAVQYLQYISRRDHGILFAADINKLPLRRSFCYLYLPTIISVLYSFIWTWVDLDLKRLEPYFQLSKPGGVYGSDAMLLSYPLEFLAVLPFTAFKRKHWSVLMGSLIMILVLWGLTPAQAGIFAVRTIKMEEHVSGFHSTAYTPLKEQGNQSAIYAQSVYNIAWLNETLPPFMTKDYVLSAFAPVEQATSYASNITFTGTTNMYSVDISCDAVVLDQNSGAGVARYNSTAGCSFEAPAYRTQGGNDTSKPYDAMYVGYQNQNGFADYYLEFYCSDDFLHYFFIRWSKSSNAFITSGNASSSLDTGVNQVNATSLFCKPQYYQQKVNATIRWPSNVVQSVQSVGEKLPLPVDMFNTSTFEWAMSSGQLQDSTTRGDFPTIGFPDQKSQLADTQLNLDYLPKMAPFAIATYQRPLEDYLDPETLRLSYQSAYRLLFARELSDILKVSLDNSTEELGQRSFVTQAVVVVPGFAYAATSLLVVVLLVAVVLAIETPRRSNNLRSDPATIGAVMDLVEGDRDTLDPFLALDISSSTAIKNVLGESRFCIDQSGHLTRTRSQTGSRVSASAKASADSVPAYEKASEGVRPTEMKVGIGIVFLAFQIGAAVTFLVLYLKAKNERGLALPSQSTVVRQLVENYIPIALATLIEPFWLVLNRLLSILRPFEELRKGCARASKSVDLDYTSLPPQLLFIRACRAGHYLLALVGLMVLAANVLSVSLSGMMYEGTTVITTSASFSNLMSSRLRALNGTGLPFNTNNEANSQGTTTTEPFYRLMSNLTAGTPLPPWTDEHYAYLPVNTSRMDANNTLQVSTTAFGASLACQSLDTPASPHNYTLTFSKEATAASLDVSIAKYDGSVVGCTDFTPWTGDSLRSLGSPQDGHVALEIGVMLASNVSVADDLFCRQHIFAGWVRADWEITGGSVQSGGGVQYYGSRNMTISSRNTTVLLCTPDIVVLSAEVVVDDEGRVQELLKTKFSSLPDQNYFTTNSTDLIAQANQFIVDNGGVWHKDSYPSDFVNYLIKESTNDTRMLNASQPVPTSALAAERLEFVYGKLFALLVSTNVDLLFEEDAAGTTTSGLMRTTGTRILFSTVAFVITEVILACYILTTIVFYVRRPWRVLPRLPSTLASIMACFAASRAVHDLYSAYDSETPDTYKRARSSWAWGYGTFVGTDGCSHVGIEKEPLVSSLEKDSLVKNVGHVISRT